MENTNGQVATTLDPPIAYEQLPEVRTETRTEVAIAPGFATKDAWELAQRQAKALMASSMVPQAYRENVGNCIIALDMAYRMGASPLMVMQNLYIVHGSPGWSAKFLIASFNQCGRFSSIRYEWNKEKTSCMAWTTEKRTGDRIEGPTITLEIAKKEGWSTKNGSKWQTMPELMLMYRAAAFLIRTYAPEISMGLHTVEEVEDIPAEELSSAGQVGMIESLLITAEIRQEEKEEIERELPTMSARAAIKCIGYLKDKQPSDPAKVFAEQARKAS